MSDFRRFPDLRAAHRRRCRHRYRRQCAALPGISARPRHARRSRHRQRTGLVLRAGPAARDRDAVREQQASRQGTRAAPAHLRGAPRPDGRSDPTRRCCRSARVALHTRNGTHLRPDRARRGRRAAGARRSAWLPRPMQTDAAAPADRNARATRGGRARGGRRRSAVLERLWRLRPRRPRLCRRLAGGRTTPQPWINVISNQNFGFHTSAEGASFTWSRNSRDFQLTPWSNDPVDQPAGRGDLRLSTMPAAGRSRPSRRWRAIPAPIYEARHGQGFSSVQRQARPDLAGTDAAGRSRRSGEDLAADDPQFRLAGGAAARLCLCRMGARQQPRQVGADHRPVARRRDRRAAGPQPLQPRLSATASPSWPATRRRSR